MTATNLAAATRTAAAQPAWGAVHAMALCVAVLIASEFMPVSLLSPIADELRLTEGQAGQAIAVSGLFAVATSLSITLLAGRLDRRILLLGLSAMLVVSGAIVALAPDFLVLMAGRALLGVAIGGFWSISAATIMRLVPSAAVPRGLAILNGGNAIATTVAAPLGSFLSGLIGWRGAFFCVVPLAIAALAWQALTLPRLPAAHRPAGRGVVRLLRDRRVATGLLAVMLLFMGQFALFTYLRPFLEQVTGVDVPTLSALLLVVGVAGFVGTTLIGRILERARLHLVLAAIPAIMAGIAVGLGLFGASTGVTAALLAGWGLVGTAAPVAWWTWLARSLPEDAEAGGGLMVAIIQLAITLGATLGGLVFDAGGAVPDVLGSAAILALAALVAFAGARPRPRQA
jgi:predicted MFS family arabinose efflux permease